MLEETIIICVIAYMVKRHLNIFFQMSTVANTHEYINCELSKDCLILSLHFKCSSCLFFECQQRNAIAVRTFISREIKVWYKVTCKCCYNSHAYSKKCSRSVWKKVIYYSILVTNWQYYWHSQLWDTQHSYIFQ